MTGKGKVVVGMSGGVDSSVSAYLLKEQGYEVVGATYDFWHDDDDPKDIYRNLSDASEAKEVCDAIGIPHYAVNHTKLFREQVEERFCREYLKGRTPNPCIICNETVKWEALMRSMKELEADYVATGHYADVIKLDNGRYSVRNAAFAAKDQTYVLYRLTQEQLGHTLFPMGSYDKSEVRRIAKEAGLAVAAKKDSQDICFIDDGDYAGYIRSKTGGSGKSGNFVLKDGTVLGPHKGIADYTVGQRKGLGIAYEKPLYVCGIDHVTGDVVLGDNRDLFSKNLTASGIRYMGEESFDENRSYRAKIRYSQKSVPCRVEYTGDDTIRVIFDEEVRAATPGQAVVIYDADHIAGGGTIQ